MHVMMRAGNLWANNANLIICFLGLEKAATSKKLQSLSLSGLI
jgi:hypothetical protein